MTDIQRLFVPYELAKLAKEKGFDEPCLAYYGEINGGEIELFLKKEFDTKAAYVLSPLYQQIIDWFREKHNLHFYIVPFGDTVSWSLVNMGYTNKTTDEGRLLYRIREKYDKVKFDSYYKALEAALEEAFKLIK